MNDFLKLVQEIKPDVEIPDVPTAQTYAEMQTKWYNENVGTLDKEDGLNCDICRNKGKIQCVDSEGQIYVKICSCMQKRNAVLAMKYSGLEGLISKTLDDFKVNEVWQERAKNKTIEFINADSDTWLYFSGQTGCGKTHLCTAACKALIDKGRNVKYLLWGDISQRLNALKYKAEEYESYMQELKDVEVLYIDDFLKTPTNAGGIPEKPNAEDIKNAYTVINARYFADKKTIISTEHFINEYDAYDSAAAGRIKEKAKIIIQVDRKPERNYRKKAGG